MRFVHLHLSFNIFNIFWKLREKMDDSCLGLKIVQILFEDREVVYRRGWIKVTRHTNNSSLMFRPTSVDSFTSQVTLDIGSTFADESEVQHIIAKQLEFHSLGNVQVRPDGFSFRIFQGNLFPPEWRGNDRFLLEDHPQPKMIIFEREKNLLEIRRMIYLNVGILLGRVGQFNFHTRAAVQKPFYFF